MLFCDVICSKTFTITGGPDRYDDRGLIPRTLSMIFAEKEARANEFIFDVSISYLEIYNVREQQQPQRTASCS